PTRQCGKTTLLDVIEALVNKPLVVSNTTGAALVRIISLDRPTLLVDEADTFLTSNEDLRGIVNAGHKKSGCFVRCEGGQNEVRSFPCYAAMVIASIRALPGTIEDRSINDRHATENSRRARQDIPR